MKKMIIRGGRPLSGEVKISGFKNAALPLLYASILTADISLIGNVPRILDVFRTLEILESMGATARFVDSGTVLCDTRFVRPCASPDSLVRKLRASSYLMGAELARFGRTRAAIPGGCSIGRRPLDIHLFVFRALGAKAEESEEAITATAPGGLRGGEVVLEKPSVGATVNAILAAVGAGGETVLRGAAREPHIADLCAYLSACGAIIAGVGSDCLRIRGGRPLHGASYALMPDMIEAGTFLCACGAAGGNVTLRGAKAEHLTVLLKTLRDMGMEIHTAPQTITATRPGELAPFSLLAEPYPGFPTDMHPQFAALATGIPGESRIRETVFPDRFRYVEELRRLGAEMTVQNGEVTITGGKPLRPGCVVATDLRAGAAEVIAALGVAGETVIRDAGILERGYDALPGKLRALGVPVMIGS